MFGFDEQAHLSVACGSLVVKIYKLILAFQTEQLIVAFWK